MHRPDIAEQFLHHLLLRVGSDLMDQLNQQVGQAVNDFSPTLMAKGRHQRIPDRFRMVPQLRDRFRTGAQTVGVPYLGGNASE